VEGSKTTVQTGLVPQTIAEKRDEDMSLLKHVRLNSHMFPKTY